MPVDLKPLHRNPVPVHGHVYKFIDGYQPGWAFVVCHDDSIQYLSGGSDPHGWDPVSVLDNPKARFVEINLQEV